jgi:acetylglutamate kinase
MTYVFYLDRYHLGDPLFLTRLAQDLARLDAPRVLVHGAGEDSERALEATGAFPDWHGDLLVATSGVERATVERATRDLNRRIAGALNDAGVAAVRMDGASRGLARATPTGGVEVAGAQWLVEVAAAGAVPVVAALAPSDHGGLVQVSGGSLAAGIAAAFGEAEVIFFAKGSDTRSEATDDVADTVINSQSPEPHALRSALDAGAVVRLSRPRDVTSTGIEGRRLTT